MDTLNLGAAPADDLEVGAEAIAQNIFRGKVNPRQVYRMAEPGNGWPIFRLQGKLAAWHGAMRAEMARRAGLTSGQRAEAEAA